MSDVSNVTSIRSSRDGSFLSLKRGGSDDLVHALNRQLSMKSEDSMSSFISKDGGRVSDPDYNPADESDGESEDESEDDSYDASVDSE